MQHMIEISIYVAGNYGSAYTGTDARGIVQAQRAIEPDVFANLVKGTEIALQQIPLSTGDKISGTTSVMARGNWLEKPENTVIVSTWVPVSEFDYVAPHVRSIANALKTLTAQDSVAVTVRPVDVIFL